MVYKDLFKEVNLGAATPEPTIFEIIFKYYSAYFNVQQSMELTIEYVNKLKETQ